MPTSSIEKYQVLVQNVDFAKLIEIEKALTANNTVKKLEKSFTKNRGEINVTMSGSIDDLASILMESFADRLQIEGFEAKRLSLKLKQEVMMGRLFLVLIILFSSCSTYKATVLSSEQIGHGVVKVRPTWGPQQNDTSSELSLSEQQEWIRQYNRDNTTDYTILKGEPDGHLILGPTDTIKSIRALAKYEPNVASSELLSKISILERLEPSEKALAEVGMAKEKYSQLYTLATAEAKQTFDNAITRSAKQIGLQLIAEDKNKMQSLTNDLTGLAQINTYLKNFETRYYPLLEGTILAELQQLIKAKVENIFQVSKTT